MTPNTFKKISILLIGFLILVTIYPIIEATFPISKYSEIALLGPNGKVGEYQNQVKLGERLPFSIYLANYEANVELYRLEVKLVQNTTLANNPPYNTIPIFTDIVVLDNEKNTTRTIDASLSNPFNGKLVIELYKFDSDTGTYLFNNRWISAWLKTTN